MGRHRVLYRGDSRASAQRFDAAAAGPTLVVLCRFRGPGSYSCTAAAFTLASCRHPLPISVIENPQANAARGYVPMDKLRRGDLSYAPLLPLGSAIAHPMSTLARRPPGQSCARCFLICENAVYGPVPPVWQSLQFTAVRSPRSIGCLKGMPSAVTGGASPSCWLRTVWQVSQSLCITMPSGLTCWPS